MVDLPGHVGMALLVTAPAWLLWGRRAAATFVAFALLTAMLPDVDLALRLVSSVRHHGVTHTLGFVAAFAVVVGALLGSLLGPRLRRAGLVPGGDARATVAFAVGGLFLGGAGHLAADLLSAPDGDLPLRPLWPLVADPIVVNVIRHDDPLWNAGLLVLGVGLSLAFARSRRRRTDRVADAASSDAAPSDAAPSDVAASRRGPDEATR